MTDTLTLPPSQAGYAVQFGSGVIATGVQGGQSRYMADTLKPAHSVRLQWRTNRTGYDYLAAFYERNVGREFNIDLVIDDAHLQTYNAYFEPDGFSLASITGGTYVVRGRLEVEFAGQTAFQEAVADLREIYGTDLPGLFVDFSEVIEALANV